MSLTARRQTREAAPGGRAPPRPRGGRPPGPGRLPADRSGARGRGGPARPPPPAVPAPRSFAKAQRSRPAEARERCQRQRRRGTQSHHGHRRGTRSPHRTWVTDVGPTAQRSRVADGTERMVGSIPLARDRTEGVRPRLPISGLASLSFLSRPSAHQ